MAIAKDLLHSVSLALREPSLTCWLLRERVCILPPEPCQQKAALGHENASYRGVTRAITPHVFFFFHFLVHVWQGCTATPDIPGVGNASLLHGWHVVDFVVGFYRFRWLSVAAKSQLRG